MHKTIFPILLALAIFPAILFGIPGDAPPSIAPVVMGCAWARETDADSLPQDLPPPDSQGSTSLIKHISKRLTIDREAVKLYAKWVIGAPALVLLILI